MRRLCLILLFVLIGFQHAHAVQPDERLDDAALEQRARNLSTGLRCLVCQNQSIDESDAPLARDLRLLVRERLVEGDSDNEVIDFVVARYGEFVLLKPRFGTHTLLLWLLPVLLLGFATLILWQRSRREIVVTEVSSSPNPLSEDEEAQLTELLSGKTDPVPKD